MHLKVIIKSWAQLKWYGIHMTMFWTSTPRFFIISITNFKWIHWLIFSEFFSIISQHELIMLENLVYDISNFTKWFSKIFLCDSKIITPYENNPVDIPMCDLKSQLVWFEKSSRVIILLDIFVSSRVIIKAITPNSVISCDYKNNHTIFQKISKSRVIIFIITRDFTILCDYKNFSKF